MAYVVHGDQSPQGKAIIAQAARRYFRASEALTRLVEARAARGENIYTSADYVAWIGRKNAQMQRIAGYSSRAMQRAKFAK